MKKNLLFHTAVVIFTTWCSSLAAQVPVFNSVIANTTTPAKFDKFELNINLTAAYTNPYDYSDIAVTCIFSAPGGRKDTVDGFFMQDYTLNNDGSLTAAGAGTFKVRYAPFETGNWSYTLSCTKASGTTTQPSQTFQCLASSAPGFIRKNATAYLGFDNGTQYFPVGENMGWQDNNVVTDYTSWLNQLAENNGNFIRVWMSSWAFALEWKNGTNGFSGLKKYKQTSAYYLDWLLNYCKQKNIYMMLTLNNHGQVSNSVNPEWADNPYNAANGGPAANTWNFFNDVTAKTTLKNRLRYIVARYGFSQNIQSWELFNEVDWTDQFDTYKGDVSAWHNEMAAYIKSKDVYKHLVTTSYAHDVNDSATWKLPDIDFTQTHYYINSPNIESILSAGAQTYLNKYHKPTLNGEFGLGPSGSTLISDDPDGVHIHNAIWGSAFGGGMGNAMSWWWDDYINPQNLYHYFKPLAAVASLIKFKDDNYKKTNISVTGGGYSDVIVTPGANFGAATSSSFTINSDGTITPGPGQLGQYLFGSVYNTQYHNPPSFTANFPAGGQVRVTTGSATGTAPQINIYVDNVSVLSQAAAVNSTYSISVSAGNHIIKVDNAGTDWITISNYTFTKIGSPLSSYPLKSADSSKAAGYLLNTKYNWQYLKDSGAVPASVTGSAVTITGMKNGSYIISFYSTVTGDLISTTSAMVTAGSLSFSLPSVAWDIAFTAANTSVLAIKHISLSGKSASGKNYLDINIGNANNIRHITIERSADGIYFKALANMSDTWNTLAGRHEFTDNTPVKGANFYRLKSTDADGSISYSAIVKIINNFIHVSIFPNPVKTILFLYIDEGKYAISVFDQQGRRLAKEDIVSVGGSPVKIAVSSLPHGVYYLSVADGDGKNIAYEKFLK